VRSLHTAAVVGWAFGHLAVAVAWWALQAHGFPVSHPRFWVNDVATIGGGGLVALGLGLFLARRTQALGLVATLVAGVWLGALATAFVLYPDSSPKLAPPLVVAAAIGTVLALPFVRVRGVIAAALVGALGAAGVLAGLRAPPPTTRPAGGDVPAVHGHASRPNPELPGARVEDDGRVRLPCGRSRMFLEAQPLLTFQSRSADGFWTIFALGRDFAGPGRRLVGAERRGSEELGLAWRDDGDTFLHARTLPGGGIAVHAATTLRRPVYAHLVQYTWITLWEAQHPRLTFSPMPDRAIEPVTSDYPFGRPARFAFLDARGTFRVVDARDAEKGPFNDRGHGPLARSAPLAITIEEDGRPSCRVTLADWARQVSVAPSPSAGWGVPQNAILLEKSEDARRVDLVFTLADTGIGRGFDSVGHAAGTYQNRLTIEPL
jgi:hypothetical protein